MDDHGPPDSESDVRLERRNRFQKWWERVIICGVAIVALYYFFGFCGFVFVSGISLLGPERTAELIKNITEDKPEYAEPNLDEIRYVAEERAKAAMEIETSLPSTLRFQSFSQTGLCRGCYEARGRVPPEVQAKWGDVEWRIVIQVNEENSLVCVFASVGEKVLRDELGKARN